MSRFDSCLTGLPDRVVDLVSNPVKSLFAVFSLIHGGWTILYEQDVVLRIFLGVVVFVDALFFLKDGKRTSHPTRSELFFGN